jgi:hypothetical protein
MKKRYLIVVAFSILVIAVALPAFLSWYTGRISENLKDYSTRLEEGGFVVEEKALTEVYFDAKQEWMWFGDFRHHAEILNVTVIYCDRSIAGLYYLTPISPTKNGTVAIIFYYNKIF